LKKNLEESNKEVEGGKEGKQLFELARKEDICRSKWKEEFGWRSWV
jgi:hypothetical protein